jgi:zinc protease
MPERNSPEYYAMGLLDQILLQGNDSRLYQALVQERGYTGSVDGGINAFLGNMFNYNGPMLWMGSLIHDHSVKVLTRSWPYWIRRFKSCSRRASARSWWIWPS